MIRCCYKCTERWVRDGKTCHSSCKRYLDAVEEEKRQKELRNDAQAGEREFREYKKQHYKSVDRNNQRAELLRRKKY